jgi:hypothetical protein
LINGRRKIPAPYRAAGVVVLVAAAVFAWHRSSSSDERAIRDRLESLRTEVNASTADGPGTLTRAVQIGSYFTENAVVDLGKGTASINGRETLMGMAARLQPRTAAFRLELDDIGAKIAPDGGSAEVSLTVSFVLRSIPNGDESRDAREFALALTKAGGTWRIARATAVETLR